MKSAGRIVFVFPLLLEISVIRRGFAVYFLQSTLEIEDLKSISGAKLVRNLDIALESISFCLRINPGLFETRTNNFRNRAFEFGSSGDTRTQTAYLILKKPVPLFGFAGSPAGSDSMR